MKRLSMRLEGFGRRPKASGVSSRSAAQVEIGGVIAPIRSTEDMRSLYDRAESKRETSEAHRSVVKSDVYWCLFFGDLVSYYAVALTLIAYTFIHSNKVPEPLQSNLQIAVVLGIVALLVTIWLFRQEYKKAYRTGSYKYFNFLLDRGPIGLLSNVYYRMHKRKIHAENHQNLSSPNALLSVFNAISNEPLTEAVIVKAQIGVRHHDVITKRNALVSFVGKLDARIANEKTSDVLRSCSERHVKAARVILARFDRADIVFTKQIQEIDAVLEPIIRQSQDLRDMCEIASDFASMNQFDEFIEIVESEIEENVRFLNSFKAICDMAQGRLQEVDSRLLDINSAVREIEPSRTALLEQPLAPKTPTATAATTDWARLLSLSGMAKTD